MSRKIKAELIVHKITIIRGVASRHCGKNGDQFEKILIEIAH
jgi:hypothetical protein